MLIIGVIDLKLNRYNIVLAFNGSHKDYLGVVNGQTGEVFFFSPDDWRQIEKFCAENDFLNFEKKYFDLLLANKIICEDEEFLPQIGTGNIDVESAISTVAIYLHPKGNRTSRFFEQTEPEDYDSTRLVNVLSDIFKTGKNYHAVIYGTDCLMAGPNKMICELIELFRRYNIEHNIVTTGENVDCYTDIIDKKLTYLNVRLVPDERFYSNTVFSFNKIWTNLIKLQKNNYNLGIYIPFDKSNLHNLPEYYKRFHQESLVFSSNCRFHLEPVESLLNLAGNQICHHETSNFLELLQYLKEFPQLEFFNITACGIMPAFYNLYRMRQNLPVKGMYCEAQGELLIFDLDGNVFKCWESVENTDNRVGFYTSEIILEKDRIDKWQANAIECTNCKKIFLCRGGCKYKKNSNLCNWEGILSAGLDIMFEELMNMH